MSVCTGKHEMNQKSPIIINQTYKKRTKKKIKKIKSGLIIDSTM